MKAEDTLASVETLENIISANWSLHNRKWQRLPFGHTNTSYILLGDEPVCVLRVSWPHKPLVQIEREAMLLAHLDNCLAWPAIPRIRQTQDGLPYLGTEDGRWLHLFDRIEGTTCPPETSNDSIGPALRALASLHGALAKLSNDEANPVAWLQDRYRRITAQGMPPMGQTLARNAAPLLHYIGKRLSAAADWIPGPVQWLHGDYHPGNLLFVDGHLHGVVDFDGIGLGSPQLELAFALFACSRNEGHEDDFKFYRTRWMHGLHSYADASGTLDTGWWIRHRDDLLDLFCIDQVLIHLEAAQRGAWSLRPGIGFLPCWQHLLHQPRASSASSA